MKASIGRQLPLERPRSWQDACSGKPYSAAAGRKRSVQDVPSPGFAGHCQSAPVIFDKTLDVRQAEAGPVFLGGEEGLEDSREVIRGDAAPAVGHFDFHVALRPHAGRQVSSPPSGMASRALIRRFINASLTCSGST